MTQPDKVMTACPSCAAKLAVPTSAVGKKIRCPKCQTVVAITAEMVSQPPQKPPEVLPIPAATAGRPQRPEVSLGAENTYAGPAKKNAAPESLGDQATFGGKLGSDDVVVDNDMEIVDLSTRYTIEGVLGKGGMGEVQLATDNRLKRKVAIKRVLGDMAKSQTAIRRFMTEAQSIAALNHPNIVQVYDYGRDKDGPFLILEYVAGNSLLDRCQQGAMPLEEAITLICHLCDGLTRAHELGIIHRDLKPANVLLTKDGVPKLTDFGLARVETGDTGQTMSGAVLGTLDFMPPEQRRDATQADARSDLWSLAATLYQMVTGKSPKVIRLNEVPASLQSAIGKALEDKPDDRYQSVAEFRNVLREVLDESRATLTNLTEGQCPSCGTKNEAHRKFCRKCAVSLEVKCLSCSKGMPVWDEVCGSCGTKQSPLITSRKEELQQRQHQAEGFLQEGKYREAAQITEELQNEADPRFQHLKKWAGEFAEDVKRQQQQQQQRSGVLHKEAKAHQAAHDYSSAIHALEQIPASLRSPDISAMLNQLETQEQRSKDLYEEIRLRVERRELDGLMPRVDELLQLLPDRVDLRELRDTLEKREQQRLASRSSASLEANRLMDARKYAECVAVLQSIKGSLRTPEIEALQKDAAAKQSRLESLQRTVDQAVKNNQLQGLLARVDELLLLKSDATEGDKLLREQLVAREQKHKSQIKALLQKVQQLRKEVRFDEALEMLRRVPAELQTNAILTATEDLQFFADQRSGAIEGLTQANDRQHIQQALALADEYRGMLTSAIIADTAFEAAMKECRRRLDELQQAEELAIRRRQRQKKLIIIGSVVSLLLVVTVAGFVVQRQQRLTAIANALQRGDDASQAADSKGAIDAYSEVVRLDDTVADAWAGLALAKLQQTPSDVTAAFGDLEKSAALSPDGEKLQQARRLAHARRAIERANAGSVTEALQDVADAEKLAAPAEEVAAAKSAVGSAYLKRAEEAVAAKQLEAALKEMQEARAISPQSDQLLRVSQMIAESYLDRAKASVQQSAVEPAFAAIEAARALQPELPRIPELQAAALVIRAQRQLQAGDRDNASADFLEARTLSSRATGLGALAASLADRLVKRCEETFSDASFQEATAALQTVAELDSQSVTLGPLKERLSKVLIVEADKGLQAKETDRVALLIESLVALQLQPEEQTRLSDDLAGQYFEQCQQQVAAGDLTASVSTFERLLALASVDDEKKQQAVTALLSVIEPLCLTGLQSQSPASAIEAVQSLALAEVTFGKPFTDQLTTLSADVKDALPEGLLETPLAIAPFDAAQAKAHQKAWADHLGVPVESTNSIGMKLVLIPAGEFMMGSPDSEVGRRPDETYHQVTLTQPFQIGTYEVTQSQYEKVIGANPSEFKETDNPVEHVTWDDALEFCRRLSELPPEKAAGHVYRLPTEAEWEYACRAGSSTAFNFGNSASKLPEYGWFEANSGGTTHPIRQKEANAFGLYDMHGNVWEWCYDWQSELTSEPVTDPEGPSTGTIRQNRGGAWRDPPAYHRSAFRGWNTPVIRINTLGFRVVREISERHDIGTASNTAVPASLSKGLIAHYLLDGNAKDVTKYSGDGIVNGAISTSDRHGNANAAYAFDGKYRTLGSKNIVLPACGPLGKSPRTVSVWAKTATRDTQVLLYYGGTIEDDATSPPGSAFQPTLSYGSYGMTASTGNSAVTYQADYADNQWHHFAWIVPDTAIPTTADIQLFLDGTLVSVASGKTTALKPDVAVETSKTRIVLGDQFTGELDDIRIYDRALTSEEVADLFKVEKPADVSRGLAMPGIAVAPFDEAQAKAHQKSWADHLGVPVESTNSIGMKLVVIPPGEFMMGSPESEREPRPDETLHQVTLTRPFQIGVCEVTQSQYEKVIGADPSSIKGPDNPVEQITWDAAAEFCRRLSALPTEKAAGHVYRLPTEAEWEYSCRAGTTTAYSFGNETSQLVDFAWAKENSGEKPQPVGQKKPNAWGLFDMHGNVWEWCQDWQGDLPSGAVTDPQGPSIGTNRADRGGCWSDTPEYLRAGLRGYLLPTARGSSLGFRVVREIKSSPATAVAPFDTAQAKAHQKAWGDHLGVPVESTNSIGMKLVVIPPGEFMMGSAESEIGRKENETQHFVNLSRPFSMSVYEVTQEEFESVMRKKIDRVAGREIPVGNVSWEEAAEFCHRLSTLPEERTAGRTYRLPTEAEWEFACRAGCLSKFSFGDKDEQAGENAWLKSNSSGGPHPIGLKLPNAWGIHDMHGNVWEWCSDWFGEYPKATVTKDPIGPSGGPYHVGRGGAGSTIQLTFESLFACLALQRTDTTIWDSGSSKLCISL